MNVTFIRRALWVVSAIAFGYTAYAYWNGHLLGTVIGFGVFTILIPVDMLLHGEEVARQRHVETLNARLLADEIQYRLRLGLPVAHVGLQTRHRAPRAPWWRRMYRRLTPWWVAVLLIAVVPVAADLVVSPARADTVSDLYAAKYSSIACALLDQSPTDTQVWNVMRAMMVDGLTVDQAADALVVSVSVACPWHAGTLKHFANGASSTPTYRASVVTR